MYSPHNITHIVHSYPPPPPPPQLNLKPNIHWRAVASRRAPDVVAKNGHELNGDLLVLTFFLELLFRHEEEDTLVDLINVMTGVIVLVEVLVVHLSRQPKPRTRSTRRRRP